MKKEFILTVVISIILGIIVSACYLIKSNRCIELERTVAWQKQVISTYLMYNPTIAKVEDEPVLVGTSMEEQQ